MSRSSTLLVLLGWLRGPVGLSDTWRAVHVEARRCVPTLEFAAEENQVTSLICKNRGADLQSAADYRSVGVGPVL